ncbi:MAG TPA: nuclear transport factor 2 family protein [Gemmatimonadaceae bacterium]
MKRMDFRIVAKWVSVPALCLAASAGCSTSPSSSAKDAASKRAAFEATTAAFHQALRTNDTVAFLSYVADEVLLMPPGEAAVRDRDALRDWYRGFLSQYSTSSLTLSNREVFVSDEFAVELGSYEWGLTPTAGGNPVVDRGNYMQVWKRQSDGQWRFAREIWNSSVPPTPSPAK